MYCAGRGRPIDTAQQANMCGQPAAEAVLTTSDLLTYYHSAGGAINEVPCFAVDPISSDALRAVRSIEFEHDFSSSFAEIFNDVVNGNGDSLKRSVLLFIQATKKLIAV
jgi:hypothetical protein